MGRVTRILGIDPGSHEAGAGLIAIDGSRITCEWSTSIHLKEKTKVMRLAHLARSVGEIILRYRPDAVALESGFVMPKNMKSSLTLAESRGAVNAAVGMTGMPVIELTPAEAKKAATGKGNADKDAVRFAVTAILGLKGNVGEDEADSLAIALAGANRYEAVG